MTLGFERDLESHAHNVDADSYSHVLSAGSRSLSPYGWQLSTDLPRRTTSVAFYAPGSTGESFLEALIHATPDPTYFTGDKFVLRDGVPFPTKRDPENVIRMADAHKILGSLPIHITLEPQVPDTGYG
jgi:hypothetical protein